MANRMNKNPFLTVSDRSKITSFPPPEEDGPLHTGEAQFAPFQIGVSDDDQRYKLSPMEADFRLQLETTECSPIRSVPEDVEMGKSPRNIQKKKRTSAQSPSHNTVMSTNSGQGSTSSATSKSRKLRPLPDMSAFDMGSNATVSSGNHPKSIPVSPMKMHCPPTPLRTPAWAFKNSSLTRSNSLVSTKILAACPPQIIDGFSSLEDSLCVDEKDGQSFNLDANSSALCESFSKDSKSLPPLYENSDQNAKVTSRHGSSKNVFKTIMDSSSEINSSSEEYSAIHLDSSNKQTNQPRLSTDFHQPGAVSFDIDFDNVSLLGSGAFANVYKAKCKSDGQFYAVKQNRRQFRGRRDRERALAEIRIMQRLQNASVSAWREGTEKSKSSYCLYLLFFIRAWQEDGYLFCQTELCCRDTCKHLMLSMTSHWNASSRTYPNIMEDEVMGGQKNEDVQRLVPGNTVWKICHDVACGLSHIHSHNIVHHDIKPLNIFFVYHAKLGALCKIGDFGMAGEIGTCEDGQEGDTAYMPSELLGNAEKQPRGDIFSLGITLYELASSGDWILPREGSRWHAIRDTSHIPELPKTRSPVMVNLVKRMISPNKSDRPTADEILTDNSFLNDSAIQYDKFLADYIRDVNNINAAKELEASEAQNQLTSSRQTPTSMQSKQSADTDRSWNVRTPTPGMMGPFS
jgi:serine/threonine protein kinase